MMPTTYDQRRDRGRRTWDFLSTLSPTMAAGPLAAVALEHLDVRPGHTVLDAGCGAGHALASLRDAAAPGGRVIGVDYSPKMVAKARALVARQGWDDVEVRRGDLSDGSGGAVEPGCADRALALSSLSATPDVAAAVRTVHDALRPGGLLFVFDMKLRPAGASAPVIRLLDGIYRLTAGYSGGDVLAAARATFAEVTVPETPNKPGRAQPEAGWPPLTMFVARKAA